MSTAALVVVKAGLLTTVQDLGRFGHQASGVPVAGPMDSFSHRLANQLVGNDPGAATLEVTLIGPELIVETDTTMAITGAHFDVACDDRLVPTGASFGVRAGSRLKFGRVHHGARAYLAVAGGVQTPPVLGSRATHLVSRMGGLAGRALVAGDRVPIATAAVPRPHRKSGGLTLSPKGRALLRVLPGPQDHWFAPDALKMMVTVSFRISPRSNRMGYRLEGPPLRRVKDGELISEPVGIGAIQVPAAGEPILLMADRQTAGGYPKIGHVISADLPLAGQLAPGDFIEFVLCSQPEAVTALIARERQLLRYADLKDAS
jgi:antagonist of KipI